MQCSRLEYDDMATDGCGYCPWPFAIISRERALAPHEVSTDGGGGGGHSKSPIGLIDYNISCAQLVYPRSAYPDTGSCVHDNEAVCAYLCVVCSHSFLGFGTAERRLPRSRCSPIWCWQSCGAAPFARHSVYILLYVKLGFT